MENEAEFKERLFAAFRMEADEHIKTLSEGLANLEQKTYGEKTPQSIIETIYRGIHTIKGSARAVDIADIESICQTLENVFANWKSGEIEPDAHDFKTLFQVVDSIAERLADQSSPIVDYSVMIAQLEGMIAADRGREEQTGPLVTEIKPEDKKQTPGVSLTTTS
ncbi:MAG: Hpt domain-containing protein, partial [SAR324 cluster bacterium]|nr:Hpt domain-containing protein [SAR324 cluster bacterium]